MVTISIEALIAELHALGIILWIENNQLHSKAPKNAITADLRHQIKAHKEELITFLSNAQHSNHNQAKMILPALRKGNIPLSFAQQRLWFLDQLGHRSAYNIPVSLNLTGRLNRKALQKALQAILQRHESLRTTFSANAGTPIQVIHPEMTIALPIVDLSRYPTEEQALEIKRLSIAENKRPFNLNSDAMIRATLLFLGTDNKENTQYILLLTLHHIASDGWSMGVLVQELATLYKAFSHGKPSPLPELSIQYADFSIWQRNYLQGKVLERQLNYWKEHLAGIPALLQLPTDHARPAEQSFRGEVVEIKIDSSLTDRLRRLSQEQGVTLYMTLLTAFQVLMFRYTRQANIIVGSPIANRNHQEVESLIGFFVNMLAMRADLLGIDQQPKSILELLADIKKTTENAYDHQDLPFELLVEKLQPARALNYNPLVQIFFALQNAPMDAFHLSGLTLSETPNLADEVSTRFDLEMHILEVDKHLQGYCVYSTDLFNKGTIERMMGHFLTLLEGIVVNPQCSIAELPLLTAIENEQILVKWNDTATDYPKDTPIHQLFEEQVQRTPNAISVLSERTKGSSSSCHPVQLTSQSLTYRELNQYANQIAHYLISLGVGSETLIGICISRSNLMLMGLLGILKAGATYVPLDPTYPQERLAFMLEDAKLSLLLTEQNLQKNLFPVTTKTQLIALDRHWTEISNHHHHNPERRIKSHHLAYILYTSGSTGQPKGVMIEHRSPTSLICWAQRVYSPLELAGVLASTSICFDLSIYEIFLPLSVGGKIILVDNALHLREMKHKHQVTLINTVPSAIKELLRQQAIPASLQTINLAGEPLEETIVNQLYSIPTIQKVYDLYGPSEDTTYSTFKLREPKEPSTIGKPIDNTKIYILDSSLQALPIGIAGELHIGGAGLARGYLNRQALTTEKFISNPFGLGKLYKTGDLACWLPNGNIKFLGRIDYQVKLRGFRIELGEIETTLTHHSAIQHSIVLALDTQTDNKQLVAYLVANKAQNENKDRDKNRLSKLRSTLVPEIRRWLQQKLPDYMIPSFFVLLDTLPLTANGKVDRHKLPTPDNSSLLSKNIFTPPQTSMEMTIAAIWSTIFAIKKISIHDNFFDLGGHSLLATQVISRIEAKLKIHIPLKNLFERPTIKGLAERIDVLRIIPVLSTMTDNSMTDDEEGGEL